ncbi:DNA replication protein DnaC [Azospirillum sp. OGB3]|nr:DNA replication protein DnaC [Azospirillum sp. OGB3]
MACAFGHRACRDNLSVLYTRTPRLLEDLALARADGRYPRLFKTLARVQLLEVIDNRTGRAATLITSQLPVPEWYAAIGGLTLADVILDRLLHSAHRIGLAGESMRKRNALAATTA